MTKDQAKALQGYLAKHDALVAQATNPYKTESIDSIDAKLAAVESEIGLLEYEIESDALGVAYGEAV